MVMLLNNRKVDKLISNQQSAEMISTYFCISATAVWTRCECDCDRHRQSLLLGCYSPRILVFTDRLVPLPAGSVEYLTRPGWDSLAASALASRYNIYAIRIRWSLLANARPGNGYGSPEKFPVLKNIYNENAMRVILDATIEHLDTY